MKKYGKEFKVGIFFIACLFGLIYMVFSTGKVNVNQDGYNIYVVFDEVAGIDTKAPVMLNGREVGKVEDINISYQDEETKIILTLWLTKSAKIRQGATASIKTLGLMGEKFIQISSSKGANFVEPKTTLIGKPYMDLDVLMDQATLITEDIGQLVNNVNSLTDEVKKLTSNLNYTVEGNQDEISRIVENLETTSKNMEEFSDDIKRNPWKLLFRKKKFAE
tara:strand:- start:246 stop:905 length:660 start_codon:yes stop_codon:yes gene_type:complete